MVIVGLLLKLLGPAVRALAVALATVGAVLVWGAVENGRDKRRNRTVEVGSAP